VRSAICVLTVFCGAIKDCGLCCARTVEEPCGHSVTAPVCVSACLWQTCLRVRTGRHGQGCLKRSQVTMVGGKLFVKSFPPHPPSETSRLFQPCRLLPVCVPVCASAQSGPHRPPRQPESLWKGVRGRTFLQTSPPHSWGLRRGTPPRDSAEAATSLSRRRKRLRPSREGG